MNARSSSLKNKNSAQYTPTGPLKVNTDKIVFEVTSLSVKSVACRSLRVTNPNKTAVQFKIKSTSPFHYIVRPFESTVQPKDTIDISIKMVLSDRNIFKYNYDRFEILAKFIEDYSDPKSRMFWQHSQSYKLAVEVVETYNQEEKTDFVPFKANTHTTTQPPRVTQFQMQQLENEVKGLRERVSSLKSRNRQAGLLSTWNFIVTGVVSFALGFLFS